MFRLSNHNLQVHFNKGEEIIISSVGLVITHINRYTEVNSYWLDEIPEYLNKKLRHIERTLSGFINKKINK
ncbi:unnamed protein product [marine sediment metagenome]|uniref:POLO box domain-containing protein n=1 Tax=marine sediment metagenome TaxID=412755 RepID=X1BB76_9ZZZZ